MVRTDWEKLASVIEDGAGDEAWKRALVSVIEGFSPWQGDAIVVRMASALSGAASKAPRKTLSDLVMVLSGLCQVKDAARPALDAMAIILLRDDVSPGALGDLAFAVSCSVSSLDRRIAQSNRASFARLLEALEHRQQKGVAAHLRKWGNVTSLPRSATQRFALLDGRAWRVDRRIALPSGELALVDQSAVWTDAGSGELLGVNAKTATARVRCDAEAALINFGDEQPARFGKSRQLTFTGSLVAGDTSAFDVIRSTEALIEQFTTGSWRGGAPVANAKHSPLRLPRGTPAHGLRVRRAEERVGPHRHDGSWLGRVHHAEPVRTGFVLHGR